MGIADDILDHPSAALAALALQLDYGVDEVVGDAPLNRYDLARVQAERVASRVEAPRVERPVERSGERAPVVPAAAPVAVDDAVAEARRLAEGAGDLAALRAAMAGFAHCELKKGARNTVFADGNPLARVMVIGEAPGRDEDVEGLPFVGRAGQLLDRMFAAIGLSRQAPAAEAALYITNVLPWRPPENREPTPEEVAMLRPFLERHVELVDPDVIVLMGNTPALAMLGKRGILRLRGQWSQALGRPVLPMTHPAYLLRNPEAKREAWADLQSLQVRISR